MLSVNPASSLTPKWEEISSAVTGSEAPAVQMDWVWEEADWAAAGLERWDARCALEEILRAIDAGD